ncbi:MAG: cytidylyltransferase domain-containing protein, partial [Endozoicomonas sp.]
SVDQVFDSNVVKVVADARGYALYFSRAAIPWEREAFAEEPRQLSEVQGVYRHVGIYAYRVELLNRFVQWGVCPLEQVEALEQLRLMWHGYRIHVAEAFETPTHGVDTQQDLQAVRQLLEAQELQTAGSGEKVLQA